MSDVPSSGFRCTAQCEHVVERREAVCVQHTRLQNHDEVLEPHVVGDCIVQCGEPDVDIDFDLGEVWIRAILLEVDGRVL